MRRSLLWLLPLAALLLAFSIVFAQDKEADREEPKPVMAMLSLNQPAPTFDVTNVKTQETKCYL